ncbi:hypothetical protein Pelo_16083 [Pelomyxa schiedti]|nr:hypothetical protein Pelo_16083 [Pelomyxa schiedti]
MVSAALLRFSSSDFFFLFPRSTCVEMGLLFSAPCGAGPVITKVNAGKTVPALHFRHFVTSFWLVASSSRLKILFRCRPTCLQSLTKCNARLYFHLHPLRLGTNTPAHLHTTPLKCATFPTYTNL